MAKLYGKHCVVCGKWFVTTSKKKDTHSKECSKVYRAMNKEKKQKDQLCWSCANATGGCSWSSKLQPVEGWNAIEVMVKEKDGYAFRTYKIMSCPKHIRG
jgi:predicted nucleic acid-binding Zn ribbon protein